MASIIITFAEDPDDLYGMLQMVQDLVNDEYANGGFDGFKPTIKIDEDE